MFDEVVQTIHNVKAHTKYENLDKASWTTRMTIPHLGFTNLKSEAKVQGSHSTKSKAPKSMSMESKLVALPKVQAKQGQNHTLEG